MLACVCPSRDQSSRPPAAGRGQGGDRIGRLGGVLSWHVASGKCLENFRIFWKAAGFMLGENQSTVYLDVEGASVAAEEFRLHTRLFEDLCRQTGGPGLVVSTHAVGDRDLHLGWPLVPVGRNSSSAVADLHGPPQGAQRVGLGGAYVIPVGNARVCACPTQRPADLGGVSGAAFPHKVPRNAPEVAAFSERLAGMRGSSLGEIVCRRRRVG